MKTALGRGAHNAFASLCVSSRVNLTTSLETRSEVFYVLDLCIERQAATRNEGKPDPCEVKLNKGTGIIK